MRFLRRDASFESSEIKAAGAEKLDDLANKLGGWFGSTSTLRRSDAGAVPDGTGVDTNEILDVSLHIRYQVAAT